MKYLVILAFVGIIGSLASALVLMMKNHGNNTSGGNKMATALGIRVALSVVLFLIILAAWKLGYIQPTGIAPGA